MGGDPQPMNAQETTDAQLKAYTADLPALMKVTNSQILPNELAQLASAQATSPGYAALQTQLYDTFGRKLNDIGNQIQGDNMVANTQNSLNALNNGGMDLVKRSTEAAALADPEYYATRQKLGDAFGKLLDNGSNLSGSEMAQMERGINQGNWASGNGSSASVANTAANAAAFGDAGRSKLLQGLQTVTQGLSGLKSGVDANLIATGKQGLVQNTGDSRFMGASQGAGSQAMGMAGNFLDQTGQNARQYNDLNANRRSGWDRTLGAVSGITGAFGNVMGAIKPGGF